jgi:hypothetical protein
MNVYRLSIYLLPAMHELQKIAGKLWKVIMVTADSERFFKTLQKIMIHMQQEYIRFDVIFYVTANIYCN